MPVSPLRHEQTGALSSTPRLAIRAGEPRDERNPLIAADVEEFWPWCNVRLDGVSILLDGTPSELVMLLIPIERVLGGSGTRRRWLARASGSRLRERCEAAGSRDSEQLRQVSHPETRYPVKAIAAAGTGGGKREGRHEAPAAVTGSAGAPASERRQGRDWPAGGQAPSKRHRAPGRLCVHLAVAASCREGTRSGALMQ